MWILGAFLAVLASMAIDTFQSTYSVDASLDTQIGVVQTKAIGEVFHAYTEAVFNYAISNPTFSGTIPVASLYSYGLPYGTVIPAAWSNSDTGGGVGITPKVYVWAPPPASISGGNPDAWAQSVISVSEASGGSYLEGIDEGGVLVAPNSYYANSVYGQAATSISLPGYIHAGSLVAAIIP